LIEAGDGSLESVHYFATDQTAVTLRFNLEDGSEFAYVRADRLEDVARGTVFMLGMDVVAGLGPLELVIYRHDGSELRIERSRLATPPFTISAGGSAKLHPLFKIMSL
jgi:hypothetical protein